jgi:hypothetical protein
MSMSWERYRETCRLFPWPRHPSANWSGLLFGQECCLLVISKGRRLSLLAFSKRVGPELYAHVPHSPPEAGPHGPDRYLGAVRQLALGSQLSGASPRERPRNVALGKAVPDNLP